MGTLMPFFLVFIVTDVTYSLSPPLTSFLSLAFLFVVGIMAGGVWRMRFVNRQLIH